MGINDRLIVLLKTLWLPVVVAGFFAVINPNTALAVDTGCLAQWEQLGRDGSGSVECIQEPYIHAVQATLDGSHNSLSVNVISNSGAVYTTCTEAGSPGWRIYYPGFPLSPNAGAILNGPNVLSPTGFTQDVTYRGGSTDCVMADLGASPPNPVFDEWQTIPALNFDVSSLSNGNYSFTVRVRATTGWEATHNAYFTINRAVAPATIRVTSNCSTSWHINGPQNFSGSGTAGQYSTTATGTYTINPAPINNRNVSVSPQSHLVQPGGTYDFNLNYQPQPCGDPPPTPTPEDPPPAGCQGNCAQFVSHNMPTSVEASKTINVSVTMANVGTTTWNAGQLYRIGSRSPDNNTTWGINRVTVPHNVPPGSSHTFVLPITTPATGGNYTFHWCMLRENVEWFSRTNPCNNPMNVTVNNNVAPLNCSPATSTIAPYAPTTFYALGGVAPYTWSTNPNNASPPTGSGTSFNTMFPTLGPKTVTVTDAAGQNANCAVNVVSNICVPLSQPSNGQVLPTNETQPSFSFTTAEGRTHYIVDLTSDPGFTWWWNNGIPGLYREPQPFQTSVTVPFSAINDSTYAQGRAAPSELQRGVTYYWRVYAYTQGQEGDGCHSAVNSFTVQADSPTFVVNYTPAQLNTPTMTGLNNLVCKQMRLSWDFTSNAVEQGFRVERSETGAGGGFIQIAQLSAGARNYTDNSTDLVVGRTYYYRVGAYTDVSPPRINYSNVMSAVLLDCTADFSSSTMSIATINGNTYTGAQAIRDGDTLGLRIVLTNTGPAIATVNALVEHISTNLTSPSTLRINKGSGNSNGVIGNNGLVDNDSRLSLSLRQSGGAELNGVKCVSPGNPTSCAPATDSSCRVSPAPALCNNWVITHNVTVSIPDDRSIDVIAGRYFITFTDESGQRVQQIDMPSVLFFTGNQLPPEFMEVAP